MKWFELCKVIVSPTTKHWDDKSASFISVHIFFIYMYCKYVIFTIDTIWQISRDNKDKINCFFWPRSKWKLTRVVPWLSCTKPKSQVVPKSRVITNHLFTTWLHNKIQCNVLYPFYLHVPFCFILIHVPWYACALPPSSALLHIQKGWGDTCDNYLADLIHTWYMTHDPTHIKRLCFK